MLQLIYELRKKWRRMGARETSKVLREVLADLTSGESCPWQTFLLAFFSNTRLPSPFLSSYADQIFFCLTDQIFPLSKYFCPFPYLFFSSCSIASTSTTIIRPSIRVYLSSMCKSNYFVFNWK